MSGKIYKKMTMISGKILEFYVVKKFVSPQGQNNVSFVYLKRNYQKQDK